VKMSYGDGVSAEKQVTLPFEVEYAYGTTSMSSTDACKKYSVQAVAQAPCKSTVLAPVVVTINNPNVQGVKPASSNAPGSTADIDSAKAGGLTINHPPSSGRSSGPK